MDIFADLIAYAFIGAPLSATNFMGGEYSDESYIHIKYKLKKIIQYFSHHIIKKKKITLLDGRFWSYPPPLPQRIRRINKCTCTQKKHLSKKVFHKTEKRGRSDQHT